MSFKAEEKKIRQVFVGDSKFIIPRNQRKYVWDEKQWRELLDDIKYIYHISQSKQENNFNHFFGSFVLQEAGTNYEIIDGQQRITTLMIVLSVICLMFNINEEEDEFGITKQYLLGNIGLKSQYNRLENIDLKNLAVIIEKVTEYRKNTTKNDILKNIILDRVQSENKKILNCFDYFYNAFSDMLSDDKESSLIIIRDIILEMKVIHIVSADELDCYDIFEILNARGVDLEESELLKNYIYKYAKPKYTVDEAKEKWKIIEQNMVLCTNNIEQFLTHFTTYKFSKPKNTEGVFRIIKSSVEKTKINELLDNILDNSELYKYFYNTELLENKIIKKCLEYFKMINHRQFRPLLLSLFSAKNKEKITEKQLETVIVFLKNFYFAFGTVCKKTSNLIENKIYDYANEIENKLNESTLDNLRKSLMKYYPEENEFEHFFKEIGYSNKHKLHSNSNDKKLMNYIFIELENYLQPTKEKSCIAQNCSIEHLTPDSSDDSKVCKVGNLLLIDKSINEKMGNKSFAEKIPFLKKSELNIVKLFIEHYETTEWTYDNIDKRGGELSKLAYSKVWKI